MSKNGHLSRAGKQAARAISGINFHGTSNQDPDRADGVKSVGTSRQFEQTLKLAAEYANAQNVQLKNLTIEMAERYLEERSTDIQQKQLENETRALELHLRNIQNDPTINIERSKSDIPTITQGRAYSANQIEYLSGQQTDLMSLSTKVIAAAGLRAHEIHTLQKSDEPGARIPSSHREWSQYRFSGGGRDSWVKYTVIGKGNLVREVRLPKDIAAQVEQTRLSKTESITDRRVHYERQYRLIGGQSFSSSWSACSKLHFGFSNGAHGMRHTYAQARVQELQNSGFSHLDAKKILSQELGHFRPEIVNVYLR